MDLAMWFKKSLSPTLSQIPAITNLKAEPIRKGFWLLFGGKK
jgi:hypothetical protein